MRVQVFPLVPGVELPRPAPAVTRHEFPRGYGVREQCLPFTAATALGFHIPSPITFGLCPPQSVPPDAHAFRSPLDRPRSDGTYHDRREFYVKDDIATGFEGNAFTWTSAVGPGFDGQLTNGPLLDPGLSFFDRVDQTNLYKLHLPYVWKTPENVDALFLPCINVPNSSIPIMCGLVETDWYGHSVNLVLEKPPEEVDVHIAKGDAIAQVLFVARRHRKPELEIVSQDSHAADNFRANLSHWYKLRGNNRNAYKQLARSTHGHVNFPATGGQSD